MKEAVCFVIAVLQLVHVLQALNLLNDGLSEKERKEALDIHNEFRRKIANGQVDGQPKATNMKKLCWDQALETEAQELADYMKFEHEVAQDKRWPHVGQTLALWSGSEYEKGANWTWAVSRWFDEVKNYKYGTSFDIKTGHYTQLAWADTTHVGCGYADFEDPTAKKFKYKKLYVCNYGTGGNVKGMAPYKTGRCGCVGLCRPRCKPCPTTTTKKP